MLHLLFHFLKGKSRVYKGVKAFLAPNQDSTWYDQIVEKVWKENNTYHHEVQGYYDSIVTCHFGKGWSSSVQKTQFLCPLIFICWNLSANVMVLRGWAFEMCLGHEGGDLNEWD